MLCAVSRPRFFPLKTAIENFSDYYIKYIYIYECLPGHALSCLCRAYPVTYQELA